MTNTTLKVITKCVSLENENFVLVQITRIDDGKKFLGTIPYTELNEKGCMKRGLNGFEMCIVQSNNIKDAIQQRLDEIRTRGMSIQEMSSYFLKKVRV